MKITVFLHKCRGNASVLWPATFLCDQKGKNWQISSRNVSMWTKWVIITSLQDCIAPKAVHDKRTSSHHGPWSGDDDVVPVCDLGFIQYHTVQDMAASKRAMNLWRILSVISRSRSQKSTCLSRLLLRPFSRAWSVRMPIPSVYWVDLTLFYD
jgi:hypothetical protein